MADDIALLLLTGALVAATAILAWYTRVMAFVIWHQLDWMVRPMVVPTLEFMGPVYMTFRFENVGNGVGNDVRVIITSEPAGLVLDWAYPSLLPKQSVSILMPEAYRDLTKLLGLDRVFFDTQCRDVNGTPRLQRSIMEFGTFRDSMATTPTKYEETSKELIESQTESLQEISQQLKRIAEMRQS